MSTQIYNRLKGRFEDAPGGAVTLADLEPIATASILGRETAGIGRAEVLNATQVKGILDLAGVTAAVVAAKAALASPALTGTPTAPTATPGTNSAQLATTAFVQNSITGIDMPVTSHYELVVTGDSNTDIYYKEGTSPLPNLLLNDAGDLIYTEVSN